MKAAGDRVFRVLLRVYPRPFRDRYGDDLVAFFAADRVHPRYGGGPLRPLRFWLATIMDLGRAALRERKGHGHDAAPGSGGGGGRLPRGLATDFRQAFRRLAHARASTAVAIVTLALGIGITTAVYALAYGVWLKPLPYGDPEQLVTVSARDLTSGRGSGLNAAEFEAYGASGAFDGIAGYIYAATITRLNGELVRVVTHMASPALFDVLRVTPAIGRGFSRSGAAPEIVLSDHLWAQHFARDPTVIGRSYDVDGTPHTIVGVMPPDFHFPQILDGDAWVRATSWNPDPQFRNIEAVARLRPGVTIEDAQRRLETLATARAAATDGSSRWGVRLTSLAGDTRSTYARPFGTLVGITVALLALACINAAAILLTRASARRPEIAMRMALGATRGRLARELLAEGTLFTAVATLLGILIAIEIVPLIRTWLPAGTPRLDEVRVDGRVLAATALASAATALICGLVPLLAQRSASAVHAIAASGPRLAGDPSRRPLRVIAVVEVAMTVLLIVAASLMLRSFAALVHKDHGFDPDRLLALNVSLPFNNPRYEAAPVRAQAFQTILDRVSAVPGVLSAGGTTGFPGSALGILGVATIRLPGSRPVVAAIHACSDDYFTAMGARLESGRPFDRRDSSERTVIVSRTLAMRLWPDAPAAGHTIPLPAHTAVAPEAASYEVIGVTSDIQMAGDPTPRLYVPLSRGPSYWIDLVVRTAADPRATAPLVRSALHEVDPDLLVENVRGMDRIVSQSIALQRAQTLLASLVAGLASLLAAAGLYGLLSYATVRRMRELGVRMALGATPRGVFGSVVRDALALTAGGAAIGIAAAALTVRLAGHSVFGLGGPHWSAFVLAPAVMLMVAVAAVWAPARRAATVDPLRVIREA